MPSAEGGETLPDTVNEDTTSEGEESPETPTDIRNISASLTSVSITQQVQSLMPSLVELIGELADKHKDLAIIITNDIVERRKHREKIEERVIDGDNRRADRGQFISWVFAMLALAFGFVLILTDRSTWGLVLVVTAVVPLMGVNLIGRVAAARERSQKMQIAHQQPGHVTPRKPTAGSTHDNHA